YLLNSLRVKVLQQVGHKETLDPFFDYAQKILSPVISDVEEIFHDALGCEILRAVNPLLVRPWLF
ncbi:UNVERIFIED_CONTAM: hypothetical protein PVV62_26045, partial [Salmonella enterica subsp. enterica serovar Rissen]